jgi:hypothetical protein
MKHADAVVAQRPPPILRRITWFCTLGYNVRWDVTQTRRPVRPVRAILRARRRLLSPSSRLVAGVGTGNGIRAAVDVAVRRRSRRPARRTRCRRPGSPSPRRMSRGPSNAPTPASLATTPACLPTARAGVEAHPRGRHRLPPADLAGVRPRGPFVALNARKSPAKPGNPRGQGRARPRWLKLCKWAILGTAANPARGGGCGGLALIHRTD